MAQQCRRYWEGRHFYLDSLEREVEDTASFPALMLVAAIAIMGWDLGVEDEGLLFTCLSCHGTQGGARLLFLGGFASLCTILIPDDGIVTTLTIEWERRRGRGRGRGRGPLGTWFPGVSCPQTTLLSFLASLGVLGISFGGHDLACDDARVFSHEGLTRRG